MTCRQCGKPLKAESRPYHYTESGLDNVYLVGVPRFVCENGHETVRIPRMVELHAVLAEAILKKPAPLTGKEMRFLRKQIGLLARDVAEELGVSAIQVSRWENGKSRIPVARDRLFRLLFLRRLEEQVKRLLIPRYVDLLKQLPSGPAKEAEIRLDRKDWQRPRSPLAAALAV
jgi:putative zinc finger/helix-turn-helix YgiT family protein